MSWFTDLFKRKTHNSQGFPLRMEGYWYKGTLVDGLVPAWSIGNRIGLYSPEHPCHNDTYADLVFEHSCPTSIVEYWLAKNCDDDPGADVINIRRKKAP